MVALPSENHLPQVSENPTTRKFNMGDRSPKSVHKQATQKQTKASDAVRKQQQAVTAKQLGNKSR
jgi:predicted secreted protein